MLSTLTIIGCTSLPAQNWQTISVSDFADSIHHARMKFEKENPPYELYQQDQITFIADNILAGQLDDGGWSKNKDWLRVYDANEIFLLKQGRSTLDNRTTWSQIEYLAKVHEQTQQKQYADAAIRGIEYLISEQRESGGWRGYDIEAITYNDGVMVGVLQTLKSILDNRTQYSFVDQNLFKRVQSAYNKGVDCVLKTQIIIDGQLTAWAQQYDHKSLKPIWARSFEPPALSSSESVAVTRFLMSIDEPSTEIQNAVVSAVTWLDKVKIPDIKLEKVPAPAINFNYHWSNFDYEVVEEKGAKPIWARYYDLEHQQAIFCTRQSIITSNYKDLSRERRTGYGWYGYYANRLIEKDFPKWEARWHGDQK
ncbi:pectate lyase [Vibrio ziniensis]|uniref:Pectate lyase n=1 Tax=Vibrio ziniensis TaxID=2711221 RepID=A0A6G7CQY0_9VIBR|nr:pectate lyase [Vibrio ziniensis]QIH44490.1 pectate lyase [Vibrio ziniensis]QNR59182.1 pectate lyase [Vibrio ziniensis]